MYESSESSEYRPFGYLGRIPLYLTTILVITYVVALVVLVFLRAGGILPQSLYLAFSTADIRYSFSFWEFFTYPLVNGPDIWFALEIYLLYSFGREVERFIGRSAFGMLYATLVLLAPCLLTAASTLTRTHFFLAGSNSVNFAVFIAFCTIYPGAEIFFRIQAKWLAAILIAIDSLQLLAARAFVELFIFWATCAAAFAFIKYLRGHLQFSLPNFFRQRRSRKNLRVVPKPRLTSGKKSPAPSDSVIESIDPLLDKIASQGIASLTDREREKLEQARAELLKKSSP